MKISIITPSLNQGKFIEETINSVINQKGDFELEYIIIDGGSTDNTLEIIRKYPGLKFISEKDSGQSEAINKGFKMATGDAINWLCSDDLLEPDALKKVTEFFEKNKNAKIFSGQNSFIDEFGKIFRQFKSREFSRKELIKRWNAVYCVFNLSQPSTFIKREVLDNVGFVNEKLSYAMDYDWYLRINKKYKFYFTDKFLSKSRYHKNAKSVAKEKEQYAEAIKVSKKYWRENFIYYTSSYCADLFMKKIYSFSFSIKILVSKFRA